MLCNLLSSHDFLVSAHSSSQPPWPRRVELPDRGSEAAMQRHCVEIGKRRQSMIVRAEGRSRSGRSVPRFQLRSNDPADRHCCVRRSFALRALSGLCEIVRSPDGGGHRLCSHSSPRRRSAARSEPDRFSDSQRVLHVLMAIMVLAMLFIGVSMVSTLKPRFLTLISIHKPLGIATLAFTVLRLGIRWGVGAPPLPNDLPQVQALAAKLSHVVLYVPLVGWGCRPRAAIPSYSMVLYMCPRFYRMTTSCTRSCE
jgi:hypothetical protein